MTDRLTLQRDGWLNYGPDDDGDGSAATRLRIGVGKTLVTRNISKRAGGESDAINISLLPLAEFLVKTWWTLLYEPWKPACKTAFQARHRLDSGMRGFSFPAMALCSGGETSIVADWAATDNPFSALSFLTPAPAEPASLDRQQAEIALAARVARGLGSNPKLDGRSRRAWLLCHGWPAWT